MEKSNTLNCGDINLAAALMSVGTPLSEADPCSLVLRDDGRNYARFHVMPCSIDFAYQTERLMAFWRTPSECNDAEFSAIMTFVRSGKDSGAVRSVEWFDYAHTYLEDMSACPPDAPAKLDDVPDFVGKNLKGAAGHVFAFTYNRDHCWQLVQQARRRIMLTKGKAHAMIDSDLTPWKRNELLARLEG